MLVRLPALIWIKWKHEKKKQSVLPCAAANGKTQIAFALLEWLNSSDKSSLISSPDNDGKTAFYFSCSQGHLEFRKWLLGEYNNCKSESDQLLHTIQDIDRNTPLITAVLSNHPEIVSWLASIDPACMKIQNKYKISELNFAAADGKIELASAPLMSLN